MSKINTIYPRIGCVTGYSDQTNLFSVDSAGTILFIPPEQMNGGQIGDKGQVDYLGGGVDFAFAPEFCGRCGSRHCICQFGPYPITGVE